MTGLTTPLNEHMQSLADEHRDWLTQFDPRYLVKWDNMLQSDNEAAMAEASVRQRLQQYGVNVEPNEDLDTGQQAPDFRCERSGIEFCVEVTTIRIETAERATGLPHDRPYSGGGGFLNEKVFAKCVQKARQANSAVLPTLVAIGTWHGFAAMQFKQRPLMNMLLTGEAKMTWDINVNTGETSDTYLTTNLYPAIFLKPDEDKSPVATRESISGALLCAFGMPGIEPLVILNPNANRTFDPAALPELEFGSVNIDHAQQQLSVEWLPPRLQHRREPSE